MATRNLTRHLPLLSIALFAVVACGGSKKAAYSPAGSAGYHASEARSSSAPAAAESTGHHAADIRQPDPTPNRPGLGTEFGEQRHSRVEHTKFVRASSSPAAMLALQYNNESGVRAALDYHQAQLATARTYAGSDVAVTITDSSGRALPGGSANGRVYVVGSDGERYNIEIRNDSRYRLEVVASVDGLDVIDGLSASPSKRGYVLQPFSTVTIDGFRTSNATVAAFRFGAVKDSYAAKTTGDRNVGVIGIAIFAERGAEWTLEEIRRRDTADPFPGYAKPPADVAR